MEDLQSSIQAVLQTLHPKDAMELMHTDK